VSAVANDCGAPFQVLRKSRMGDRSVSVAWNGPNLPDSIRPVLVDDIISSGQTTKAALAIIQSQTSTPAVALAVHGLHGTRVAEDIKALGAILITSNTVPGSQAGMDITDLLLPAIAKFASIR
jgi:ribose-phosphate pyrophosphokinase